jgi:hypothetical protein
MSRLAVISLLLLASLPAAAGYDNGNRLYEDCSSANYFNRGYCGGYVVGIVDAIESLQRSRVMASTTLCIPDDVSKGQLVDVVTKYLGDNPQKRTREAAGLVPEALNDAFPCKR